MDVEHLHHLCIYLAATGAAAPAATSGRREINPTTYHQYSPSDRSSDVYARSGSDLLLVPVSPRSSEAALQEASLQPLPPVPLASEFMLSLSLYLPLSLTHRHTFSLSLSLSLSHSHTHTGEVAITARCRRTARPWRRHAQLVYAAYQQRKKHNGGF